MTDEATAPEGAEDKGGPDIGPLLMGLMAARGGSGMGRADGVGQLLEETAEFVDENLKPDLLTVSEPETGVQALAYVDKTGVHIIAPSVFDAYRDEPRFRRGTAALTTIDSLILHAKRFKDEDSIVFADDTRTAPKLTIVLDYHRADIDPTTADESRTHGDYRMGKHRSTFAFPLSDEWAAWIANNHKPMSMAAFSTFLEKRIGDIALKGDDFPESVERFVNVNGGPDMIADYASLVELSRGLKVYEKATVEEAQTLSSGEGHLRFTVEHETRTAKGGTLKVPTMFFIAIPVFKRGTFYRIAAALRYRKTAEGLTFWYDLWREDRSFDDAFNGAVAKVEAETGLPVLFGSPEA